MRAPFLLLIPYFVSVSAQQGGFFSGIGNAINSFLGSSSSSNRRPPPPRQNFQPRPQPPRFQPQPQQSRPQFQQPQQFNNPPPQQFNSQPSQFNSQPSQFNSQPSQFNSPPSQFTSQSSGFSSPSSQFQSQQSPFASQSSGFSNQPSQLRPQRQFGNQQQSQRLVQQPQQQVQSSCPNSEPIFNTRSTVNGCSVPDGPNFFSNGVGFVVTWKFGCSKFTQQDAQRYCGLMNMVPVSLDTPNKQNLFNKLIAQDAQRYFWTGGEVNHDGSETVGWNNGCSSTIRWSDSAHWSHTGGAKPPRAQPDNRAATEDPPSPEVCLGILNNFYADGIKWHDVACHHKKPTVCEPKKKIDIIEI